MPPKQQIPAPIDRPLARAYLREFAGWSTAYPPGISEPSSLRVMENTQVNRDGSLRIRPGLRYLSFSNGQPLAGTLLGKRLVGSWEPFFLNNGDRAFLFAVREANDTVGFRVAWYRAEEPGYGAPFHVVRLDDPAVGFAIPAGLNFTAATKYVRYLQIDNKILALSDAGETVRIFYVGATKKIALPNAITRPDWQVNDMPRYRHPDQACILNPVANKPIDHAAGKTAKTLLPEPGKANEAPYNIGYFYTFSNELGETMASQVRVIKVRRPWTAWLWETATPLSEPSGLESTDPDLCADQIFVYPGEAAYGVAKGQGARAFNVYALMWSDQAPAPVEGLLVGSKEITADLDYADCWVRHSPAALDGSKTAPTPSPYVRTNYTEPARAGQGLVAADRLILVNDPAAAGVIRWSSNQVGDYLNFSATAGGGYKTLTSGNLYVPACVKLWQNPQSVDTLTILCAGVDGHSTAYYMAPAQVASQSEATNIMGFEETTATPGTTSPYGCEVLNNALYHPLESELAKSTASNYNINHKPMTDDIANSWRALANKKLIVSSQLDNRLYYLVHNPAGPPLPAGCRGNEVWVLDVGADSPHWSRWLVDGISLRKVAVAGQLYMSIVRADGVYCFDPALATDDYVAAGAVRQRPISWRIETNTQGANRAHDAWCRLQQLGVELGNFTGQLRYGIRGRDLHGRDVDVAKVVRDDRPAPADGLPYDLEDFLAVQRDLKEWRFYAESVTAAGVLQPSAGQINLVQYRYAPISVNVGYEYGSVETFEYARNVARGANAISSNGVPTPFADAGHGR